MIIFFAAFMTAVISIYQGVVDTDRTLINAARVLGARDREVFLRVVVPAAMPFVFVGIRIALAAAWSTLVASELVAAQQGLGYRMQIAGIYFDLPTIYFNIIVIGVLGFAMDKLLMLVEDRLLGWQER
jgi:NitT/TauT family transport system permease protein